MYFQQKQLNNGSVGNGKQNDVPDRPWIILILGFYCTSKRNTHWIQIHLCFIIILSLFSKEYKDSFGSVPDRTEFALLLWRLFLTRSNQISRRTIPFPKVKKKHRCFPPCNAWSLLYHCVAYKPTQWMCYGQTELKVDTFSLI